MNSMATRFIHSITDTGQLWFSSWIRSIDKELERMTHTDLPQIELGRHRRARQSLQNGMKALPQEFRLALANNTSPSNDSILVRSTPVFSTTLPDSLGDCPLQSCAIDQKQLATVLRSGAEIHRSILSSQLSTAFGDHISTIEITCFGPQSMAKSMVAAFHRVSQDAGIQRLWIEAGLGTLPAYSRLLYKLVSKELHLLVSRENPSTMGRKTTLTERALSSDQNTESRPPAFVWDTHPLAKTIQVLQSELQAFHSKNGSIGRIVWPVFSGRWTPPRFVPIASSSLHSKDPALIARKIANNLLLLAQSCLAPTGLDSLLNAMRGPLSYLANEEPMFYAFPDNAAQTLLKIISADAHHAESNPPHLLIEQELRELPTRPLHTGTSFKKWLFNQLDALGKTAACSTSRPS